MGNTVSLQEFPGWIIATQWASRAVLAVLVALSVWSVAIMVDRLRVLRPRAKGDKGAAELARRLISAQDWPALQKWAAETSAESNPDSSTRLPAGTLHAALQARGTAQADPEAIDRAVRSYLSLERSKLEHGLTALATMGSNAPFIGLFGTVLGIIQAFGALAAQSSDTRSVMTGISEALVATAVGLFVAIPAVIAYNVFARRMKLLLVDSESLRDYYLSRAAGGGHGR